MRIAFFGGTFDPPHLGHLRIALAAADRLHLDRVLFAPVALQPLKRARNSPATSYDNRVAMVQLLLGEAGDPRFEVSKLDAPRGDSLPNYTYDTLARLRATLAPADNVFLLTGVDALLTLPQWHSARELVLSTDFIVAARPGFLLDELYSALLLLVVPSTFRKVDRQEPGIEHLVLAPGDSPMLPAQSTDYRKVSEAHFYLLTDLAEDISSTAARTMLFARPGPGLVPPPPELSPAVVAYIHSHALYR